MVAEALTKGLRHEKRKSFVEGMGLRGNTWG
jgi:hypothetical protein